MKIGLGYSNSKRLVVYRKLRRQVVAEFRIELEQATGWRKDWVRWKRGIALEIRYNQLLFSKDHTKQFTSTSSHIKLQKL